MKYTISRKKEPLRVYMLREQKFGTVDSRRVKFADGWIAEKDVRIQLPDDRLYSIPMLVEGETGMVVFGRAHFIIEPRNLVDTFIAEMLPTLTAKKWDKAVALGKKQLAEKEAA